MKVLCVDLVCLYSLVLTPEFSDVLSLAWFVKFLVLWSVRCFAFSGKANSICFTLGTANLQEGIAVYLIGNWRKEILFWLAIYNENSNPGEKMNHK